MPVIISPESELGKEMAKWEQGPDHPVRRNPLPYPRMLYKAQKTERGKVLCGDVRVAVGDAEATEFTQRCQRLVGSEDEHRRAKDQGWRDTPEAAIELFEQDEQEIGRLAAEAAFHAQRMSDKAQRELDAADASTHAHVVDVKGGSQKRRGRKPRAVAPSDPELD